MNYHVSLSLEAEKAYRKANSALIKKLDRCLEQLEINPYSHLNRVVYFVDESNILVNVILIAHRSKVYE